MNFNHGHWMPLILLSIALFVIWIVVDERKYFKWVETYWFYTRSFRSRLSSFFYLTAMALLLISLLDLRGPEEKRKLPIPDQKTIIILDSSASMMVEDIRPNRFQKGVMIARHFIKKAVGHQIAVVLFSDTQKRLIPFTDDMDLLDARIEGLNGVQMAKGGSNIFQALLESLQYFKLESGNTNPEGNILLITDTEENGTMMDFSIPKDISLAVVGVGSTRGGPIPLYNQTGSLVGYKTYQGEQIISKLSESFFDDLQKKASRYKYWKASSYNISTEEIIGFFRHNYVKKLQEKDIRIRPVLGYYLVIAAIILLIASFFIKTGPSLITLILFPLLSFAQTKEALEDMKNGQLNRIKRLKLAEDLLREKKDKEALILYEENIDNISVENEKILFNYATALLKNGQLSKGLDVMSFLQKRLRNKKKMELDMQKNILLALDNSEKKESDQEQNKDQNKEQNKDKNKDEKKTRDNNKNDEKSSQEKQSTHDGNKKKDEKERQDEKDNPSDRLKEKEEELRKKKKKVKIPALLKQLLHDDRNLQNKYFDASTSKNKKDGGKDW